ncbi:hypothetical protein BH09MYX1_BH09MYX1_68110 [soil metagenome]
MRAQMWRRGIVAVGFLGALFAFASIAGALTSVPSAFSPPDTLAGRVFDVARKTQEYPGVFAPPGLSCEYRAPGDESIPETADPTLGPCGALMKQMTNDLKTAVIGLAGSRLGIPAAAFEQIQSTMLATTPNPRNPSERIYRNFQCMPRGASNGNGTCRYRMPARRVNAFPDGVELVFVDDDKEYTNAAFIPFLILFQKDPTPDLSLSLLCDPPTAQAPGTLTRRAFTAKLEGNKFYRPVNCTTYVESGTGDKKYSCDVSVQ